MQRILEGTVIDTVLTNRLDGSVATPVNCLVANAIGLDVTDAARDYIHLYRGDSAALAESLGRIQRTAALILTAVETS
jgi:hypothetical protein